MACLNPDPPSGGCPEGEARALERFGFWFGPVLLAGPVVMLGAWAGFSPRGRRYGPVWYLMIVMFFCVAPGLLVDAASTSFAAVDRVLTETERLVAGMKLASAGAAAVGASACLAYLANRRGQRTFAGAWAACSACCAVWALVTLLPDVL